MAWEQGGKYNTLKMVTILMAMKQRPITLDDIDNYVGLSDSIRQCLHRLVKDGLLVRETKYDSGKRTNYIINDHFIKDITNYIFEVPVKVKDK